MEPIAIVTAFLAALYIFGRGPLLFAPAATASLYRRVSFSTPGRMRILGVALLVLVAAPLIITARLASDVQGDVTSLLEGIGWFTAVAMMWVIIAPGFWRRLADSFWSSASDRILRVIGVLNFAIGLGLGWVAFFVL